VSRSRRGCRSQRRVVDADGVAGVLGAAGVARATGVPTSPGLPRGPPACGAGDGGAGDGRGGTRRRRRATAHRRARRTTQMTPTISNSHATIPTRIETVRAIADRPSTTRAVRAAAVCAHTTRRSCGASIVSRYLTRPRGMRAEASRWAPRRRQRRALVASSTVSRRGVSTSPHTFTRTFPPSERVVIPSQSARAAGAARQPTSTVDSSAHPTRAVRADMPFPAPMLNPQAAGGLISRADAWSRTPSSARRRRRRPRRSAQNAPRITPRGSCDPALRVEHRYHLAVSLDGPGHLELLTRIFKRTGRSGRTVRCEF